MSRSDLVAAVALALLLPVMVVLSRDFGVTYDERFQQKYGEEIWDYVNGRRARAAFDTDFGHQNLYGGSFELAAVAVQRAFPQSNVYAVRHAVNAAMGWVAIVFCWLIGRKLFGDLTGALAAVLLLATPRFAGHSMNNPKDIPFAAFGAAAVYFLVTLRPPAPFMTWPHAVKLAAAIGLALSVRPVGLLFGVYLGLLLLWFVAEQRAIPRGAALAGLAGRLGVLVVVVVLVGVSAWPWAQADPIRRPLQAFFEVSRFDFGGSLLFAGEWIPAFRLPAAYLPTWFAIGLPPVLLAGALLSLLRLGNRDDRRPLLTLWVFVLLPVTLAVVRGSTLYDGMRHFLFVVPPLAALAASGWVAAVRWRSGPARVVAVLLLAAGLAEPVVFAARNHPNEVVYFTPLAGGPRAAFGRYDMDYWGNCMFGAARWAADRAREAGMPLAVTGRPEHLVYLNAERVGALYFTRPQLGQHHFSIHLLRGPADAVREFASRATVLHRVQTADGAPLCVVLEGPLFPQIRDRISGSAR